MPDIREVLPTIFLLLGLCTVLVIIAMAVLLWTQVHGAPPLRSRRDLRETLPFRPTVDWEVPLHIGLVVFMTIPPNILSFGVAWGISSAVILLDILWWLMAMFFLVQAWDNLEKCCRYYGSELWPTTWAKVHYVPQNGQIYVYRIGDRHYEGQAIAAQFHTLTSPITRAKKEALAPEVLVYYRPDDPQICLLKPGVNWSSVSVMFGLSIGFFMTPLIMLAAM